MTQINSFIFKPLKYSQPHGSKYSLLLKLIYSKSLEPREGISQDQNVNSLSHVIGTTWTQSTKVQGWPAKIIHIPQQALTRQS